MESLVQSPPAANFGNQNNTDSSVAGNTPSEGLMGVAPAPSAPASSYTTRSSAAPSNAVRLSAVTAGGAAAGSSANTPQSSAEAFLSSLLPNIHVPPHQMDTPPPLPFSPQRPRNPMAAQPQSYKPAASLQQSLLQQREQPPPTAAPAPPPQQQQREAPPPQSYQSLTSDAWLTVAPPAAAPFMGATAAVADSRSMPSLVLENRAALHEATQEDEDGDATILFHQTDMIFRHPTMPQAPPPSSPYHAAAAAPYAPQHQQPMPQPPQPSEAPFVSHVSSGRGGKSSNPYGIVVQRQPVPFYQNNTNPRSPQHVEQTSSSELDVSQNIMKRVLVATDETTTATNNTSPKTLGNDVPDVLFDRDSHTNLLRHEWKEFLQRATVDASSVAAAVTLEEATSLVSRRSTGRGPTSPSQLSPMGTDEALESGAPALRSTRVVVLTGKAGAGKSTLVPAALAAEVEAAGGYLVHTRFDWTGESSGSSVFNGSRAAEVLDENGEPGGMAFRQGPKWPVPRRDPMATVIHDLVNNFLSQVADRVEDFTNQKAGNSAKENGDSPSDPISDLQMMEQRWGDILADRNGASEFLSDFSPQLRTFLQNACQRLEKDKGSERQNVDDASNDDQLSNVDQAMLKISYSKDLEEFEVGAGNEKRKKEYIRLERSKERLFALMRSLFRAFTGNKRPIVLWVDDLHWANQTSMEFLEHLATDPQQSHLLLLMTWRTEGWHEEEAFSTATGQLGLWGQRCNVKRIHVDNLSRAALGEWMAKALQQPVESIDDLVTVAFNSTSGNPLHAEHFLQSLIQDNLLNYDSSKQQYTWEKQQFANFDLTPHVGEMILRKLQSFSTHVQSVLQVLSCCGQSWGERFIQLLLERLNTEELFGVDFVTSDVSDILGMLLREDVISKASSRNGKGTKERQFTFSHALFQEASLCLIPKASMSMLQLRVGEVMLEISEDRRTYPHALYLGVDLCNGGTSFLNSRERTGLALYCLLAGEKAQRSCDFVTAATYFETGLRCLRVTERLGDRLSLELGVGAMENGYCCGEMSQMSLHYDRVMSSPVSNEDRMKAYTVWIKSADNPVEALSHGIHVLRKLEIPKMPEHPNKVALIIDYAKTRLVLRKHNAETIARLPQMTRPKLINAIRIFEVMVPFALETNSQLLSFMVMKTVRWTIKYGVCRHAAVFFAILGASPTINLVDLQLASTFGQAALRISDRFKAKESLGFIQATVFSQVVNWTMKLPDMIQALDITYRFCLETADRSSAHKCLVESFWLSYMAASKPLDALALQAEWVYCRLRDDQQPPPLALIHDTMWQMILILKQERSVTPTVLTGRVMVQDDVLLEAQQTKDTLLEFVLLSRQMQLAYFFDDFSLAESIRLACPSSRSTTATTYNVHHTFFSILVCMQQTGSNRRNQKHYRLANRLLRRLHQWVDQGFHFGNHLLNLAAAEMARLDYNNPLATRRYRVALQFALKKGCLRDAAMVHERAGMFFLSRKDNEKAGVHLREAVAHYRSWGAEALANKIVAKYSSSVIEPAEGRQLVWTESGEEASFV